MNFEDYWQAVVRRYPHLEDEASLTTLRVSSLRALMEQAHDHGVEHGKLSEQGARMPREGAAAFDRLKDIFKGI